MREGSGYLRESREGWMLALLMAVAFALFANTFGHGWTYDDFPVIVENPDVRSWGNFLRDSYRGRPLRELTFLLDHALFGLEPTGWHLQSIFWHGLNAWLVFLLWTRLHGERAVALAAGLLFLVHPLQVEVVANISHRKDSLALAFSLLALLAYRRAFPLGGKRWGWLALAAGLAWTAYQGKQNAVLLPAVFWAWELAFLPRRQRLLARLSWLLPAAGLLALAGAGGWWLAEGGSTTYLREVRDLLFFKANYLGPVSLPIYLATLLKCWGFMYAKFLWPSGLAVEYTLAVPRSWLDPWVLGALAAVAGWAAGLGWSLRRRPAVFVALAWIGVFWLPVSNLWPLTYLAADRYLYAPAAGVCFLLALLLRRLVPDLRNFAAVAAAAALVLAVLTWQQNRVWRSPETLWTRAVKVSPESSFALNNMGNIHLLEGEREEAKRYYLRAVEVNPGNPTAQYNLGMIYEQEGDVRGAVEYYRNFVRLDHPLFRAEVEQIRRHLLVRYGIRVGEDGRGR